MSLKVLLISYKFSPNIGGIETSSLFLADVFIKAGYEVRVLTSTAEHNEQHHGYKVIRKPSLLELLKHHLWADIIIENNPSLRLGFPQFILKKKSIVILQTWLNISPQKTTITDKARLLYLSKFTKVIAISKAIQERCWTSSLVIGNSYDSDTFRLHRNERKNSFVFVGRLVSDKGAELAIQAFSHLVFVEKTPELFNSTLTIIGDGDERQRLETLIRKLPDPNRVKLLGSITGQALAIELNKHTFQFIPSLWEEPFGIVALEGISCGLIPIVSDGGGLPEATGKAGIVFKRGQLDSLVNATRSLVQSEELQEQHLTAAQEHLKNFSSQHIGKKYTELIEKIGLVS